MANYVYTLTPPKNTHIVKTTYEVIAKNKSEAEIMFKDQMKQDNPSLCLEDCEVQFYLK